MGIKTWLAWACFTTSAAAMAGNITGITVDPATIPAGGKAKITVSGDMTESDFCAILVEFSGAAPAETIKLGSNPNDTKFPVVLERVFSKPGRYDVKARGAQAGTALKCSGKAETLLTVQVAAASSTAQCPVGSRLIGKAKADGTYSCRITNKKALTASPKASCASGQQYFENKTTFGCRK